MKVKLFGTFHIYVNKCFILSLNGTAVEDSRDVREVQFEVERFPVQHLQDLQSAEVGGGVLRCFPGE